MDRIHTVLNDVAANAIIDYRIIGAGAVWAMGLGGRRTADFDILVEVNTTVKAKKQLLQHEDFGRTPQKSIYIRVDGTAYNIDILTPPRVHLSSFPPDIYDQHLTFAHVAPVECVLASKIGAYRDPGRKDAKRATDIGDITFLLGLAVSKSMKFGFDGVQNLDKDFVLSFRKVRSGSKESFDSLGCSVD